MFDSNGQESDASDGHKFALEIKDEFREKVDEYDSIRDTRQTNLKNLSRIVSRLYFKGNQSQGTQTDLASALPE